MHCLRAAIQILDAHLVADHAGFLGEGHDQQQAIVSPRVLANPVQREATEEELIGMVKDRLGSVKAPKSIDFMADLPRSAVGKVLKTELRKPYWQGQERNVS